ncbi:MAG TPA: tetratricopeptide repeat protein [Caulobacteraceae bacterium]|jgi:Flp pilus assembly protein TadD
MSRKRALAATVPAVALALLAASPAGALPFGIGRKKENAPASADAPASKAAPAKAQAKAPAARRASAEERTMVERLDPLARATFWAREFELDARDLQAGVSLSAALRAMGRNSEAADASARVLAVKPDHVEGLLESARAQIGQNEGFYAIEPARKAMTLAPKDWRAPSLLGVAYQQVGRLPEARQAWEKALALSPENPAVLANLALADASDGRYAQAEGLLRRAAARPGSGLKVRQNLALVLGLQGKFAEAERLVREDMPPEAATAHIAWLHAAAKGKGGRSWDSLKAPQTN